MPQKTKSSSYRSPSQRFGKPPHELGVDDYRRLLAQAHHRFDLLLLRENRRKKLNYLLKRVKHELTIGQLMSLVDAIGRLRPEEMDANTLYEIAAIVNTVSHQLASRFSLEASEKAEEATRIKGNLLCSLLRLYPQKARCFNDAYAKDLLVINLIPERRGLHIPRADAERNFPDLVPPSAATP